MGQTERLYRIEALIRQRGHVSFAQLQQALEVSRATLWRDIEYLRSRLGAPIEYDRFFNGYRFAAPVGAARGQAHELPGLWFSERELYALLMAHQLLSALGDDGMLGRHLQPLLDRIHELLGQQGGASGAKALMERVRIIHAARRPVTSAHFELVGEALLERRRLHLRYLTRSRAAVSEREVSPQRLVHHRNTWYLDAFCHRADDLRRFALDGIEAAQLLPQAARDMPLATVRRRMDAGYGIYAGARRRWAVLRVEPQAAQWISREEWHPEQQGRWRADGRYELRLPFADETELAMDVLRHGDEIEVLAPASLRESVSARLQRAAARYAAPAGLAVAPAPAPPPAPASPATEPPPPASAGSR